jgi:hypothetical protein
VDCQSKNSSDGGGFNHRDEGFIVVDAILLLKPLDYKSSLKSVKSAINLLLHFKNPLVSDNIMMRWLGAKEPGLVGLKGLEFFLHGLLPMRRFDCLKKSCRNM